MRDLTAELMALQDLEYRDFSARLMPNIPKEKVIGVRTPAVRNLAKQVKGTEEAEAFMAALPHQYQEENVLHGCLIEQLKDYDKCIEEIERFLPYVDNWAVCDLMSPKVLAKHKDRLILKIREWIKTEDTYTVRFGVEMLMSHYLNDDYRLEYSQMVAELRSEEYYVNMMIAWYFATALAKQYDTTLPFITEKKLDVWVHNKTIQKAVESRRITAEQKEFLRTLRIKNPKKKRRDNNEQNTGMPEFYRE